MATGLYASVRGGATDKGQVGYAGGPLLNRSDLLRLLRQAQFVFDAVRVADVDSGSLECERDRLAHDGVKGSAC